MVFSNATKTQFLHLSIRDNLPHNYDIFFENTQLKPTSVFNILVVSFSHDLSWKDHITSLSKQASKRLVFSYHPSSLLFIGVLLFTPVWSTSHTSGVNPHSQLSLTRWSVWLFVLTTLPLLLILSNLFSYCVTHCILSLVQWTLLL